MRRSETYFFRKNSITVSKKPATEIVVTTTATNPSNSLYVLKYETIKPILITLRKISNESIFSEFIFYFSSNHPSRRFDQNISPTSDSNNSNNGINIHILTSFFSIIAKEKKSTLINFHFYPIKMRELLHPQGANP